MIDKKFLLEAQRSEITEHNVYSYLSKRIKDPHNKKILKHIAEDQ